MPQPKFICPECREKFRSIGFGFEYFCTSVPDMQFECRFCHKEGLWKDQMVTPVPYMFMNVIMLERKVYPDDSTS